MYIYRRRPSPLTVPHCLARKAVWSAHRLGPSTPAVRHHTQRVSGRCSSGRWLDSARPRPRSIRPGAAATDAGDISQQHAVQAHTVNGALQQRTTGLYNKGRRAWIKPRPEGISIMFAKDAGSEPAAWQRMPRGIKREETLYPERDIKSIISYHKLIIDIFRC